MTRTVSFRRMQDGTREDYLLLDAAERQYAAGLGGRVLEALRKLDHSLEGYRVSRLGHSLQAATRAERDGADEEMVLAALVHDIGDELAPYNHADLAAAILRPYVRPEVTWIVAQHALFQNYYYVHHFGGDRHAREQLREHPWYDGCVHFCAAWDQNSFDPDYPSEPLAHFEPLLQRIFARPPHDPRYVRSG
ncbi:MAG: HD domain-containing protein [Gammaproteobacteria bacterium]|nr:HD domain-containing protein [Gammaproteobacteria bacterium]MBV9621246.1 HD domain-containing protein [Gammaproteobacteria bacterium]